MSELGDCDPIKTIKDLKPQITKYLSEKPFTDKDDWLPAVPCGLVAKSFFNDKYNMTKRGETKQVNINRKGIAWESDYNYKFKNLGEKDGGNVVINGTTYNYRDVQWIDMKNGKNFKFV